MAVLAKILALTLVGLWVVSAFGRMHYMLDNLSSFKVHFVMAFAVCAAVLVALREWRWAAPVAGVALGVWFVSVLPWYTGIASAPSRPDAATIRVMMSNVLVHNSGYEQLATGLLAADPDVVGLVEVNTDWIENLGVLEDRYPYRHIAPDDGYRGFALYSKIPIEDAAVSTFGDEDILGIRATLRLPAADVDFVLTHPLPPMTRQLAKRRNEQLQRLGEFLSGRNRTVIVAGDLNVAMWSPFYKRLEQSAGLKNARDGFGVAGTWPAVPLLAVPIDHILHSEGLQVLNFEAVRNLGSDHYGVLADIALEGDEASLADDTVNRTVGASGNTG